jgi:hypothetical protein
VSEGIEAAIASLAGEQRGYVTRRQLLELGLRSDAISYRQEAGRLLPVHAGVYAVGHQRTLPQDKAFAAILACGPGAVLSHATAATVWGIYRRWTTPFHVTVATARRREGIHVHRAKLHTRDLDRQLGLPVTSPSRTLFDNAPELTDKALTRAVNDLLRGHFLVLEDLAATVERHPRHPAAPRLREFVEASTGPTASEFEDAFTAFCRRFSLPQPLCNTKVAGFEVDAYFPEQQVIVELDSWRFHSSRSSFESDRERDATMLALGIVTVRITWKRLTDSPEREAVRLRKILEPRSRQAG